MLLLTWSETMLDNNNCLIKVPMTPEQVIVAIIAICVDKNGLEESLMWTQCLLFQLELHFDATTTLIGKILVDKRLLILGQIFYHHIDL